MIDKRLKKGTYLIGTDGKPMAQITEVKPNNVYSVRPGRADMDLGSGYAAIHDMTIDEILQLTDTFYMPNFGESSHPTIEGNHQLTTVHDKVYLVGDIHHAQVGLELYKNSPESQAKVMLELQKFMEKHFIVSINISIDPYKFNER